MEVEEVVPRTVSYLLGTENPSSRYHCYCQGLICKCGVLIEAIERRRERLGVGRAQEIESSVPRSYGVLDSSEESPDAHLERSNTIMSPIPSLELKPCPPTVGKIPRILLDITNQSSEDSLLTPQKKLLNSIDTVEKEVIEELQKLKRSASAKKAERDKKVRTLMSMR
ncbi:hypothetical protein GH714_008804 [Hevea brasiliensis]|uniref:Uncharacterized protein n=1 Tax=Hevea brasiliensis TaxID=3981 RepID=A0A6A6MJ96_HEVBR|nr:hypothetical protein GH714_008804 [Hevea brasiliensis]